MLAFALRLALLRDSLFGDELFMFRIVHGRSLADVLSDVRATEKTPPLFFLLVWGMAKVGDPTVWMRVPSLVFGTALVPLTYVLGVRTVGRAAGVVAAAIVALDPFAVFYGTEGRAYSALAFLAALSTLCLLSALDRGSRRWWVAYGLVAVAVLYTHYMGVFVLIAQAVWAGWVQRDGVRELLVVHGLIVLAYLPWIPSYLVQQRHSADEARRIALIAPPSLETFAKMHGQALLGHPALGLSELPGRAAVGLGVGAVAVAVVVAAVRAWRGRAAGGLRLPSAVVLVGLLAVVTPAAVGAYSLVRPHMSFMLPRNLSPSLPALAALVGWLLVSLGRRVAIPAVAVLLGALVAGTASMFDQDHRRPSYRGVAGFIDARARQGDPVIDQSTLQGPLPVALVAYFERPHPIFRGGVNDGRAWERGRRGARVFMVFPTPGAFREAKHVAPLAGPGNRFIRVAERRYRGVTPVLVGEYALR